MLALAASGLQGAKPEPTLPASELAWRDARELTVEGKGWTDTKAFYDRLPIRAEGTVRDIVWQLSRDSAGICVRFVTDAPSVQVRWTLTSARLALPTMPASSVSGLDLYRREADGRWRWLGFAAPTEFPANRAEFVREMPAVRREYLLYLPLYNGVSWVEVGVPLGHRIEPAPVRTAKPIVFYGTSITQGQAAARAGMVHTAILGRRFDRPVINLGFSGNGKMEPEMAALVAELDPVVFFLDCIPNMPAPLITERVEPFVRALRAKHPATPIVLAEDRTYEGRFSDELVVTGEGHNHQRRAALQAAYRRLVAAGVSGLYYVEGEPLLRADGEATVDGSHPSDLGFWRQANAYEKVLAPLLAGAR